MMRLFLKEYCVDWIGRTCATKYEGFCARFLCMRSFTLKFYFPLADIYRGNTFFTWVKPGILQRLINPLESVSL